MLHYIWSFLLALAVLIVIHELGHFSVARLCGVKVLRFSLGFGRTLFAKRFGKDQTEWAVCVLPLGGYVKMLDESEGEVAAHERHRAFNVQPVSKRAAIVAAGPIANLLLAVVVYWALFVAGSQEVTPLLGPVAVDSAAARAGFVEGERIERVGDTQIRSWNDIRWALIEHGLDGNTVRIQSRRPNGDLQTRDFVISKLEIDDRAPDVVRQLGFSMPIPPLPAVIGEVVADSAAARAALQPGDEIRAVDGVPVRDFREFSEAISQRANQHTRLEIVRGGRTLEVAVQPDAVNDKGQPARAGEPARGRLGVAPQARMDRAAPYLVNVSYGVGQGLSKAIEQTWTTVTFSLRVMLKMVTGDVSLRNVSGPVTIADYAGKTAQVGLDAYLRFVALISISLAVLNLLPIPILDGGHLLYYVAETIRGKPVPDRWMEVGQRAGFAFLAALMALAFFNDINRLIFG